MLSILLVLLSLLITVQAVLFSGILSANQSTPDSAMASKINPKFLSKNGITLTTAEPTTEPTEPPTELETEELTTEKPTEEPTTKAPTTAEPTTEEPKTIPFATAIPPKEPADYKAQWDAGYLIAIDNPDKIYECAPVKLTEEDRDLLERLCYGEFGSGGFIGAALIAQAVKDAMCFDGYPTVESVIINCRYTGSTERGTSEECRQAVAYIFDENHDAVQHRLMYMYNPNMVQSAFHESQNYILTYEVIRFFDRWGY